MTTIPSPAPPSPRLDLGGDTSTSERDLLVGRRGRDRLFIDQLDEAPDPRPWHRLGQQPWRPFGLPLSDCDCHKCKQAFWTEFWGGIGFLVLVVVVLVYLFVVAS